MTTTLLDLSGKIDKVAVSALGRIHQISSSMNIPFFIVGATARDILLEVHYGIESKRATVDIDIAVFIENWEQFKRPRILFYFSQVPFMPERDDEVEQMGKVLAFKKRFRNVEEHPGIVFGNLNGCPEAQNWILFGKIRLGVSDGCK